jgi:hypothetical protein
MIDGSHDGTKRADEMEVDLQDGTQLGKRYANDVDTVELMCVKPGQGTLTLDGSPLGIKAAKQLPSSD